MVKRLLCGFQRNSSPPQIHVGLGIMRLLVVSAVVAFAVIDILTFQRYMHLPTAHPPRFWLAPSSITNPHAESGQYPACPSADWLALVGAYGCVEEHPAMTVAERGPGVFFTSMKVGNAGSQAVSQLDKYAVSVGHEGGVPGKTDDWYTGTSYTRMGRLVNTNGQPIKIYQRAYEEGLTREMTKVKEFGEREELIRMQSDRLTLGDLLTAAGRDAKEFSNCTTKQTCLQRKSGLILDVSIDYYNHRPGKGYADLFDTDAEWMAPQEMWYDYTVTARESASEFFDGAFLRRGVQINFHPSSHLGVVSFGDIWGYIAAYLVMAYVLCRVIHFFSGCSNRAKGGGYSGYDQDYNVIHNSL